MVESGLLSIFLALFLSACSLDNTEKKEEGAAVHREKIVALGDSLTEGYGVGDEENYPALLEKKLRNDGYDCTVINAGISGELSVRTLRRLDNVLQEFHPDIVILETGINDGLYGRNLQRAEANIDAVLQRLKDEDVTVLFVGMKMFSNFGAQYAREFDSIYPRLADKHNVIFMPFFLEDVALQAKYNIEDGLHPNEEGYKIIVNNLYPYIKATIERHRKR